MPVTFTKSALLLALMLGLGQAQAADPISPAELATNEGIPYPAVIAHRGASYDAPESTAAAYKVARDLGADYLELDLQRSKDGVLFALHDNNLQRTTDVATKFPERKDAPANEFTWKELQTLDAGSWFNAAYPDRARPGFVGLKILSLDDIIKIAEGNPQHKPGLYIETKEPKQFPGIEADLKNKLLDKGWLSSAGSKLGKSNTGVGQGKGRVVLQTFETASLKELQKEMPNTPKILLLWVGEGSIEPKSKQTFAESGEATKAAYYAKQEPKDAAEAKELLAPLSKPLQQNRIVMKRCFRDDAVHPPYQIEKMADGQGGVEIVVHRRDKGVSGFSYGLQQPRRSVLVGALLRLTE